ncbi:hypothetical protein [Filimonas effusa]|nr:hypothetical protein [Filimonas effusa]
MRKLRLAGALVVLLLSGNGVMAQQFKDGKLWLNEDGTNYFKMTLHSQFWIRNTEMNPGSTINGYPKNNFTDIGIRRARVQAFGQVADRVFLYSHFGINNFNYGADRKPSFFVHDITGEYEIVRKHLWLGTGLAGWNGLTRFSGPSTATIMGLDIPLFELTTFEATDQFLRKFSLYAKGKFGKFDYRVIMSNPMSVQKSNGYSAAISEISNFSPKPPKMQWHGYFQWQFLDQESNATPYATGTYLGSKRVFNIGAGFQYQPEAMWHKGAGSDTVTTDMRQFAVDAYYDAPVNKHTGTALSAYAAFVNLDYGPGYLRNLAVMNPANGTTMPNIINGSGNGYPTFGTGNVVYAQLGYKLKNNLIGTTTLMPYASVQHASYERLDKPMTFWDLGLNWLLKGHTSKLTFAYQNRPVFETRTPGANAQLTSHKGSYILQYQVFLN